MSLGQPALSPGVSYPGGSGGQSPPSGPSLGTERELLTPHEGDLWDFADSLRTYQVLRVAQCRRWTSFGKPFVDIGKGEHGWTWGHVHRCASVWVCPVCAAGIVRTRRAEIEEAVAWWRAQGGDVRMVTVTVRHRAGMSLLELRKGLSAAWRSLQQSKTWRAVRENRGIEHTIKCHEVTFGVHGWHPHLHIMLFERKGTTVDDCLKRMRAAWEHAVGKKLPVECIPSDDNGLVIGTCRADYLSKMALEIASTTKSGRHGNLSAWQVGRLVVAGKADPALWREYAAGMRGAHQLQWSRGLKEAVKPKETDLECVSDPKEQDDAQKDVICEIPRETWRQAMAEPGSIWTLYQQGKGNKQAPDDARRWIKAFFENRAGTALAEWEWIAGRARLHWLA